MFRYTQVFFRFGRVVGSRDARIKLKVQRPFSNIAATTTTTTTTKSPAADFQLGNGKGYLLTSGLSESLRLNLQYFLWRESLGFNIHPSIPRSGLKAVADVATGTGAWLLDVGNELPDAQLDGLDIDTHRTPPTSWLSPAVAFRKWNFFEEPPDDIKGKYDLVHVRLVVLAIDDGEAAIPVIRNLAKLLKPGGYLQWDEVDGVNMSVRKVDPALHTPALDALTHTYQSDGKHDWTLGLPGYVARGGFEDAVKHEYSYKGEKPWLIRPLSEQAMMMLTNYAAGLESIGKIEAAEEFLRLVTEAQRECAQGAAFCFPRFVIVARKSG